MCVIKYSVLLKLEGRVMKTCQATRSRCQPRTGTDQSGPQGSRCGWAVEEYNNRDNNYHSIHKGHPKRFRKFQLRSSFVAPSSEEL